MILFFRSMEKEHKAAQLTIFYNGQVVVFDDFPADKVQEMMSLALATKGISQSQNSSAYAHTHNQQGNNHPSTIPNIIPQAPSTPIANGAFFWSLLCLRWSYGSRFFLIINFIFHTDMPIGRKASLHRFLEKRKDRYAIKNSSNKHKNSSFHVAIILKLHPLNIALLAYLINFVNFFFNAVFAELLPKHHIKQTDLSLLLISRLNH